MRVVLVLLLIQLLFGVNMVTNKLVVTQLTPLLWGSWRFAMATIILAMIGVLLRRPHPKPDRAFLWPVFALSLLGLYLGQGLFLAGLERTSATNAAILMSLIPVLTVTVIALRRQETMTLAKGVGLLLALLGSACLLRYDGTALDGGQWQGNLLVLAASFCIALFVSYGKSFFPRFDALWTTVWLFGFGAILFTLTGAVQGVGTWPDDPGSVFWWAATFSVLGGTVLVYLLNHWSMRHARPGLVALMLYLQPVFAAMTASLWLQESLSFKHLLAGLLIFLGMLCSSQAFHRWLFER